MSQVRSDKPFTLAGRTFQSRLLVGTGKYREISVSLWVLCVIFIAKFVFL